LKGLPAWLLRGWDRLTIYLPIVLAGALALGTYWLVRNAPKLTSDSAPVAPTHEADYFMRGFVVKRFLPNGDLRSELRGAEGRHFPDTDTLEVDQVRMRSISPSGLVTNATANRGLSNADASEVQLFGNAVVVREQAHDADGALVPRLEFRGDFLWVFADEERVSSTKPVTLTRDRDVFTAESMDYDKITGVANLKGRVRGLIQPPARQAGGAAR